MICTTSKRPNLKYYQSNTRKHLLSATTWPSLPANILNTFRYFDTSLKLLQILVGYIYNDQKIRE